MGAKSFRSVKKTVVLTTFWKVMSAAARRAFRLEKTWVAWASMVSPARTPVSGIKPI